MNYAEYLESPWWRARKAAIVRYRGERCERCGSTDSLELHHRTYERLGRERPEDVELLCHRCHKLEHDITEDAPRWRSRHDMQRVDALDELREVRDA